MSAVRSLLILASLAALGAGSAAAQEKPPLAAAPAPAAAGPNWVSSQGGAIPPGAFQAGYESAGFLYLCRANTQGGLVPGKVRPGFDGCFVPVDGREVSVPQYEVAGGPNRWVFARDGNVPPEAVEVGRTRAGQPLYACRSAGAAGQLVPGKTGAGLRGCNIGVGGVEQTQPFYHVLVRP